jgi:hypothetical protein
VKRGTARVRQIVVTDAGFSGTERYSADAAALGAILLDGKPDALRFCRRGSRRGDDGEKVLAGLDEADTGRGEPAAIRRGFAHQLEQLRAGFHPHDRFIGRAQRREHPRQALLLLLDSGLFVHPIEIAQRKRNILCKALQQPVQFGAECAELAGEKHHDADGTAVLQQGKRRARLSPADPGNLVEMSLAAELPQIVVADVRPSRAESVPGYALSFGTRGIG